MRVFHKIIFDVDNVLADTMTRFCQVASSLVGYEVGKQQIRNHKVVGSIPLSPQAIFNIQEEVWRNWQVMPPLEDNLLEKMCAFKEAGFEIYIATATVPQVVPYVKQWLSKEQIPYTKFFHCYKTCSKRDIEAEVLVDDSPEEVRSFVRSRRQGFLYLQPWNSTAKVLGAILVRNIDDVLNYYGIRKDKHGTYRDIRWREKD